MRRLLVLFSAIAIGAACGSSGGPSVLEPAAEHPDAGAEVAADAGGGRALCVDGKSVDGAYPKAAYDFSITSTIPDLALEGVAADGSKTTVALHDYFEPCASRSRLLVLRVTAAWCGPCRWDAAHTADITSSDVGDRVRLVEVLTRNEDNVPASADDAASWRTRSSLTVPIATDPKFQLGPVRLGRGPLPFYVLIDTRTMQIEQEIDAPEPDYLLWQLRVALADLDHQKPPAGVVERTTDGFDRRSWDLLQQMKIPDAPPPDPTNAKADDPGAVKLGSGLFYDTLLSPSGTVACATCHDPSKSFSDAKPQATGVSTGDRNSPSIVLASHARWQFWDGRADTLWAQALGPFENDKEFASSRLFVAHAIFDRYKISYEAVFGALPPLSDTARFPASGKPGDAAWSAMAAADREAVTRVYVNVGKSIAAFERTLRIGPSAFDTYLGGDKTALSEAERTGLHLFFSAGCIQCHWGPRLTDDAFHDVRFPTGRADGKADEGRKGGIAALLASEFRADGPFSDAPSAAHGLTGLVAGDWTLGAFKTPSLRGVTLTAPYGHGGSLATMTDVLKTYSTAGLKVDDTRAAGPSEPWLPMFASSHVDELVPFMQLLDGSPK
jgi:cytochrome c peroxidase